MVLLDSKTFTGGTVDMNGQLFQTIKVSKDATQYVKTVEALECYAFKNYTVDLSSLFQRDRPEIPVIGTPRRPIGAEVLTNPTMQDIYQIQLKEYIKEERTLKVSLKSIWVVIWGQCSTSICTKLEKRKDIKELKKKADVVELLKFIQEACMNYEDKHHPCVTLCQQFSSFHLFYQKESYQYKNIYRFFASWLRTLKGMEVNLEIAVQ